MVLRKIKHSSTERGDGLESQIGVGIPVQIQNKLLLVFKYSLCGSMQHEEMVKSLQLRKKLADLIFTAVNAKMRLKMALLKHCWENAVFLFLFENIFKSESFLRAYSGISNFGRLPHSYQF